MLRIGNFIFGMFVNRGRVLSRRVTCNLHFSAIILAAMWVIDCTKARVEGCGRAHMKYGGGLGQSGGRERVETWLDSDVF